MRCTVIIPTYDHQDLLHFSIESVLNQTIQDFEILVIGDGAPPATDKIMADYCKTDHRIKYFPHPKGDGHGETYRHEAIKSSKGKYIFYLCDDDMWMPHHIESVLPFLQLFDFVHTCHTSIDPEGKITYLAHQLSDPLIQQKMCDKKWNFFGPTCVAHTREAYDRLPDGWQPRPDGMWSDLYMWRQWIQAGYNRFFSIPTSTTLHFPSPLRRKMSLADRIEEVKLFEKKLQNSQFREYIQSAFVQQISQNTELQKTYMAGLLTTVNSLLQIQLKNEKLIHNLNLEVKNHKEIAASWTKEYQDLKSAWSTRLGFLLTSPIRKMIDFFAS